MPSGTRTELEPAVGGQAEAIPELGDEAAELDRLGAQEVRPLGLGEDEEVVHQPADPPDLRLDEALDVPDLLLGRVGLRRQYLELSPDHGQRRAQLVRGVGDELALAGKGLGEPVQHVVEGLAEHPHLVLGPAGNSIRGPKSPASTRAAIAAIRRSGAETRAPAR